MAEKVLIACVFYNNGESYEDHFYNNTILGVYKTFEGVKEAFEDHIEAIRKKYKLEQPDKHMQFHGCLGYHSNPTEFHFYARYKASENKRYSYDNSSYTYYYLVKEVGK